MKKKKISPQLKYNRANPEKKRIYALKYYYGITLAEYEVMLESQNYGCAICGSKNPGVKKSIFSVDHDHKTKRVRGLLCGRCNSGIGLLYDSEEILLKAMLYLKNYGNNTAVPVYSPDIPDSVPQSATTGI